MSATEVTRSGNIRLTTNALSRLRDKRMYANMTYKEVADAIYAVPVTYRHKELGINPFTLDELEGVCQLLDTTPGYIING